MTAKWKNKKVLDAGTGTFEYYIKIVPTKFHYLHSSEVVDTNQYSGTFFPFLLQTAPPGFRGR